MFHIFARGDWAGAVFLGCIGLAFWLVYLRRQDQWWAIIPGGVLLTLSLVAGLDFLSGWSDVLFFLGMGLTFSLVALLPHKSYNTRWAFIPAGVLFALGILQAAPIQAVFNYIWPVILVGLGIYILVRNWK
jgi:hypothetical protein